jgi:hypothetical protein
MFASKYVIKLGMESPKNMDKATWIKEMLHAFYDLCIKAIDMKMRPNTHFDKGGCKIFVGILQRKNWSCIHQGTTEEQIEWLQKGLEDMDEAHL